MNLAGRVGRESSVRWSWLGVAYCTPVRAYRSWWAGPVAEARADLAAYRDRLQKADAEVRRGAQASKALDELRSRSLGGDEETVDHRVRTQLNRLLESLEVSEATVTTSEPRTVGTSMPRSVMGRAQASLRKRRDEPDFATLEFKIGGVAPVGRVLGLLTELLERKHGLVALKMFGWIPWPTGPNCKVCRSVHHHVPLGARRR